eukprot:g7264.t1
MRLSTRNHYHFRLSAKHPPSTHVLPVIVDVAEADLDPLNSLQGEGAAVQEMCALLQRHVEHILAVRGLDPVPAGRKSKRPAQVISGKHVTLHYSWRRNASRFSVLLPATAPAPAGAGVDGNTPAWSAMETAEHALVVRISPNAFSGFVDAAPEPGAAAGAAAAVAAAAPPPRTGDAQGSAVGECTSPALPRPSGSARAL